VGGPFSRIASCGRADRSFTATANGVRFPYAGWRAHWGGTITVLEMAWSPILGGLNGAFAFRLKSVLAG